MEIYKITVEKAIIFSYIIVENLKAKRAYA